jgi:hypothetical protein
MLTSLALLAVALGPGEDDFSGAERELDVAPPRVEAPDISVDGRLDEPEWAQAARLTDFTQYEPVEGRPAQERTEVLVFYSSDAIYFGVRAFDSDPDKIQVHLGQRDRSVFNDDWIRIMLDTFNDQRQAYVFYVNPLGIQTDGLWIEGFRGRGPVPIDFNPDFIWDSDAHVTEDGWVAEIRIPYVSIRFKEVPVQDWGLNVARETRRNGFKDAWAPLTQDASSTLAQSGRLTGLRELQPRRLVEITPVVTGKSEGASADGVFTRQRVQPEAGVDVRYGITQNLVLDATVNPDFSQVEADADQLTINERFAIFLPEARPFFLDGAETFRTPSQLVYTRRIVDPSAGAKLTGKVGSFAVAYMGAADESPNSLLGNDGRAVFNMVRVRRDVGTGSNVGVLYTDRTMTTGGAFNRVAAGDARILFGGRHTLTAQYAHSWQDGASEYGTGSLLTAQLQRSGRNLSWDLQFEDIAPGFRADAGFIRRSGDTRLKGQVSLNRYGKPGALVERVGLSLDAESFTDHVEFWRGGSFYEGEVQLWPSISFRGSWTFRFIVRNGYFRFRQEDYDGVQVPDGGGGLQPFQVPAPLENMWAVGFMPRLRLSGSANLNGRMFYREIPIYGEASRGVELQVAPEITFRPTDRLEIGANYTYSRIRRQSSGAEFSRTNLSRLRVQYQFTKALRARTIGQYSLEERDALRDPITGDVLWYDDQPLGSVDRGTFQGQFLLSYEPSPGTIFYAGYSRIMEGVSTYALGRMDPMADGFFVKISYRFRM